MKKVLYLIAAALVTVVACNKNTPDPKPDPTPATPDLVLTTPKIVDVAGESSIYTVKFNASKTWEASLSYFDENESGVKLSKENGLAGDAQELKVTFQGLTEEQMGRLIQLDLKAGSTTESILFFQGLVFLPDNEEAVPTIPVAGGKYNLNILTNMDVTIKKYDGAEEAFPWAPVTINQDEAAHKISLEFNVAANTGYDARTCYVKFTMPEIQVPVLDDEGTPTGETKDMVTRFYLTQEGPLKVAWTQQFTWTMFPEGTRESIAQVGDYLIINCSKTSQGTGGAHVFKKSDGSYVKTLDIPSCTGITNDDAGNIVVSAGGDYPLTDTWALDVEKQIPLAIYAFTKSQAASIIESGSLPEGASPIITYANGFYGYGLDNIRVTGDVTGDAVITMVSSGGTADFFACDWEIKGGKYTGAAGSYTSYITLPNNVPGPQDWGTPGIWSSKDIVAKHVDNSASSKIFYNGYDFYGNLQLGTTDAFETVLTIYEDPATYGNEGYQSLATAEWNGHKYLAFVATPYFAWADWNGDGVIDSNLPGYLWLLNVDDPAKPVVESKFEYYSDYENPDNWQYGDSSDVTLVVEGNDLVAYVVDAASSQYMKVVYPKL